MPPHALLVRPAIAAVAGALPALAVLPAGPAAAASGEDATVVVSTFTLPATDVQGTRTVMCPDGTRATGGGAAPSPPLTLSADTYRIFYSAPVDETGTASGTTTGDVPKGWQVSVGQYAGGVQGFKVFVVCSATSDAVLASVQPSDSGLLKTTVTCPAGTRAIGGGMGKQNDTVIPGDTTGPSLYETGPVDGSGTVAATQDGDVATGWRTVAGSSSYGNRFFAVCSATSDAVVRSASYTLAQATNQTGGTALSCPAGTRALSGGQANDGAHDDLDRLSLTGPFGSPAELDSMSTGAVPRAWSAYGRSSETQARTNRVFALCATDPPATPPPADTTPPQTSTGKGLPRRTFATKGTFTFTSEAGASFTCALDKVPAVACTSPFKVKKLKTGKHRLAVTATDAAGNTDPTPAVFKWKVLKKRRPAHSGGTGSAARCR